VTECFPKTDFLLNNFASWGIYWGHEQPGYLFSFSHRGFILYSLIRGLVREIFSFLAIIFGFLGASYGYAYVSKWLGSWVDNEVLALVLGFLILLIVISVLIGLLGRLLSALLKGHLTWADRIGGAAFVF